MALSLSVDNFISQNSAQGALSIPYYYKLASSTTGANTTSGYISGQRLPTTISMAELFATGFGTGVTGAIFTQIQAMNNQAGATIVCGIEIDMGSLAVSTNVFTDGSTMGTRTVAGSSVTMASVVPMLVVTSQLTAATPVITTTYTNQAGVGSKSSALTLPSNSVANSAFMMSPHLASGDTGIRDVTNMSKSAGTVGVLHVYGLLPLQIISQNNSTAHLVAGFDPLTIPLYPYSVQSTDTLAFYIFGTTSSGVTIANLNAIADN